MLTTYFVTNTMATDWITSTMPSRLSAMDRMTFANFSDAPDDSLKAKTLSRILLFNTVNDWPIVGMVVAKSA